MSAERVMSRAKSLLPEMHVHIVGVGGTGMSAIAQVLLGKGYVVSGSDMQANELTAGLKAAGVTVFIGHAAENCIHADLVVASSAVPASNPELVAARRLGIPVLKRAEFLGMLMEGNGGIAVAGSHGKTTTTGMIAQILIATGHDPTVIAGSALPALGSNGRAGRGRWFVVEADEYDFMFLGLRPSVAVVTNIEHDHPDMFPTTEAYRSAFADFAALVPTSGLLIACMDDPGVASLLQGQATLNCRIVTYGLADTCDDTVDLQACNLQLNQFGGFDFLVSASGTTLGIARLRVPGEHNVLNALAAIAVAREAGIPFSEIVPALAAFDGMNRRFQIIGEVAGVTIVDDYAHHPTEIRATLAAARQRFLGKRIWAIWQPHTYSRTILYLDAFASSFDDADQVIVMDIYRSREQVMPGVSAVDVVDRMDHPHARYIGPREEAAGLLLESVRPGDVVITLGAGDGNAVGQWLLDGLREQDQRHRPTAGDAATGRQV